MARILITWELGGNFGHLSRLLPVADGLRDAGHEVLFAVRDTRIAARLLTATGHAFVQAPIASAVRSRQPPASYAEMLLIEGYGTPASLLGCTKAWLGLIRLFQPQLVIADHSPTALVAARISSVPVVQIGEGFEIPPDVSPLPSIRPWQVLTPDRLRDSEARVVSSINLIIEKLGGARKLERLADLFCTRAQMLTTFAELDHYRQRAQGTYCGVLFSSVSSSAWQWQAGDRPRVVAYLHNGLPGLRGLIDALRELDAQTVCVVPEISPAACRKFSSRMLNVRSTPIELASALAGADLVVGQGGIGVTAQSLLAGVPVLLVPGTTEQYLLAQRVAEMGSGQIVGQKRNAQDFTRALTDVLSQQGYRRSAAVFSKRYSGFSAGTVARQAVEMIESIVSDAVVH